MIAHIIAIYVTAFFLGGMGLWLASRNEPAITRRERLVKFSTYFFIVSSMLFAALGGHWIFASFVTIIAIVGARELFAIVLAPANGSRAKADAISFAYVLVAAAAIAFARLSTRETAIFV